MGCKICGSGACASWMHSADEQNAFDSLEDYSERELKLEIISLRGEVEDLKREIETVKNAN